MSANAYFQSIKATLQALGAPEQWLRPPASPQQIASAEAAIGQRLPEEWRALYSLHDGEADEPLGLFLGMPWLPLRDVVSQWQSWAGLQDEYGDEGQHYSVPPGFIKELYINPGWIPISHDHGGNHLGIDLQPASKGRVGQFINFGRDQEIKQVIAHSAQDLFRFLAEEVASPRCQLIRRDGEPARLSWRQDTVVLDCLDELELPLYSATPKKRRIEDPQAWRDSLPQPWPKRISDPKAFLQSKLLHLMRKELTDLEPLRHCHGLRALFIAVNEISDLSPLAELENLKTLSAVANPITDLSPLGGLENLRELNLNRTLVSDLGPLGCLASLVSLQLLETPVSDVGPLASINGLKELSLSGGVKDLSPLVDLPKLSSLTLSQADSSTVGQLGELKSLKKLTLEPIPGTDLDPLDGLGKLKELTLKNVVDADIGFLARLPKLEQLHLIDCQLTDVDALAGHPRLKVFSTYGSTVNRLDGLTSCPSLESFTGSIDQFLYLKDLLPSHVDFSKMTGDMTEAQQAVWLAHQAAQRKRG